MDSRHTELATEHILWHKNISRSEHQRPKRLAPHEYTAQGPTYRKEKQKSCTHTYDSYSNDSGIRPGLGAS